MGKTYDVLLMDLDDTLLDYHRDEKNALEAVFAAFNLPYNEENYLLFRQINGQLWINHEAGLISKDNLLNSRFKITFEQLGVHVDGHEPEAVFRALLNSSISLAEGAVEFCETFCQTHIIAAVTNGTPSTQRQRLRLAGLDRYFSHLFISEEIGCPKPFPEFFDYVFAALPGVRPERILLTGDTLEADISGGCTAGMDTCWVNPNGKGNYLTLPLTYEVKNLTELTAILKH